MRLSAERCEKMASGYLSDTNGKSAEFIRAYNDAIVMQYSKTALQRIKHRAWQIVEGK